MIKDFFKHLFPRMTLENNLKITYTFCLGGLAFTAFLMLIITGVLMLFYYSPSVENAYNSIIYLEENVFAGAYIRSLHKVSSHAFIILIFAHSLRVLLTGAFSKRQYNWIVGMCLLFLMIVSAYTGYLLPMDQLAYWATQTGMELLELVPFGNAFKQIIVPDGIGGSMTLLRFYILHIFVLPWLIFMMSMLHFYRIRKDKGLLPYL